MMFNSSKQDYESIPSSGTDAGASSKGSSSKAKLMIPLAIVLLAGLFFAGRSKQEVASIESPAVNFPNSITKAGMPLPFGVNLPTTTDEALEMGWVKIEDEACNEKLGEAWRKGGVRSKTDCVTLYFTPQVGDSPGYVSAIEADYYDNIEENLVGTYFTGPAVAEEGKYWSLAVLLRKPTAQGLCDTSDPVPIQEEKYFAVAPELINSVYPLNSNDPETKERFMEGMCSPDMGFHHFSDVVGGPNLTYEAANLVPVTPMYNSQTGEFQAFYLIATDVLKRQWPYEECGGFGNSNFVCGLTKGGPSMWDFIVPAMWEKNMEPFFFCNQFCDKNCHFSGAKDFPELGIPAGFLTMHFFFDAAGDHCEGFEDHHYPEDGAHFWCRDKSQYPDYDSCDGSNLCA